MVCKVWITRRTLRHNSPIAPSIPDTLHQMSYVILMFKFYWRLRCYFHAIPALFKFWQLHISNVAFFSIIIPEIWNSEPSVVIETALPACSLISSYWSVHRHTPCTLLNAIDCILLAHLLFCNHIVTMVGDPNLTSGTNKKKLLNRLRPLLRCRTIIHQTLPQTELNLPSDGLHILYLMGAMAFH